MPKGIGYGKGKKEAGQPALGKWSGLPDPQGAKVKPWTKHKRTRGKPPRQGGGRRAHFELDPFAASP